MSRRARGKFHRFCAATIKGLAFAYPASLALVALALRFVGERHWVTSLGLYLPRFPFGLPLLPLVGLLLLFGLRRLLWTQAVAAWLFFVPLMGWVAPLPTFGSTDKSLSILSYNVNSGWGDYQKVADEIIARSVDLVFTQETFNDPTPFLDRLRARYPVVEHHGDFVLASRYPIVSVTEPERIQMPGRLRSPRFIRYVVQTPVGPVSFYNIHPISPRGGFYALRAGGFKNRLLSGQFLRGEGSESLQEMADLREKQIAAAAEMASHDPNPKVLLGDMNLPGLSRVFGRYLSDYQDGFRKASWGFGYTFPNRDDFPAWMRLDRILASDEFKFLEFDVGCQASDHRCVWTRLKKQ
ncbi:MAG TPA: endonuclease/exonuclease/phosphatase family protein [Polyangiaceae bacterium]|nr:endonuclease/exonuclease/phosphatase family protein [Polyangiaceae bacterium]